MSALISRASVLLLLTLAAAVGIARAAVVGLARINVSSAGVQSNATSWRPSISDDGRYVAYSSNASNLVTGDTNGSEDVFVRDRQTGQTERVSLTSADGQAIGTSQIPFISGNGRVVAFYSHARLLPDAEPQKNGSQAYLRDLDTGVTERVSQRSAGGEGNGPSNPTAISLDGRFVAFVSDASDLVNNDTNGLRDFFLRDRLAGITERLSVASGGAQTEGSSGGWCALSDDGNIAASSSAARDMVPDDTNTESDIFVRDRQANQTVRVSVSSAGAEGDSDSDFPTMSSDGRFVAFRSFAKNLTPNDTNGAGDIFAHDRQTGDTERISVTTAGDQANDASILPRMSGDGRFVAFVSYATNLVPGDTNGVADLFVRDLQLNTTERISLTSGGAQANAQTSDFASLSQNGGLIAFASEASNLVAGDTNNARDIFVAQFTPGTANNAPTANAGPDQTPTVLHDGNPNTNTVAVTLNGSGSDPEGDPIAFQWKNGGGTIVGNAAQVQLNLQAGAHSFTLRVTDSPGGKFAQDSVTITVSGEPNRAPIAKAGPDQTVSTPNSTAQVQLGAHLSSDPDGDPITAAWFEGNVQKATGLTPTLSLPLGQNNLKVVVRDSYGVTSEDEVVITVTQVTEPMPDLAGSWQKPLVITCTPVRGGGMKCILEALTVRNDGQRTAKKSKAEFYLSKDAVHDASDVRVGSKKIAKVRAGASKRYELTFKLPAGVDLSQAHGKFLIAVLDSRNKVREGSETNNDVVSTAIP